MIPSFSGWRAFAGLAASAALFGLYARGGHAYLLGFVALVPWLLALECVRDTGGAIRHGWLMSIAFVLAVFAWFGFAIGAYTGIGAGTGLVALLIAAPLLQPQLIAFALVRHLVGRRHGPVLRALAGAGAWVATEWLVPRLLDDTLGHGLYPSSALRQLADLGGAPGMSVLLILVNEAVAAAIERRSAGARTLAAPVAIALALPLAMTTYGLMRLSSLMSAQQDDVATLRVGLVQANIVGYERLRREMGAYAVVRHVLDTHFALSREATGTHDVDALLWSETVYPTTFGRPKSEAGDELDREILDFVALERVPLVFGTYDLDDAGEYNAAAIVEPGKGLLGVYRKTNPFPLTEYVPDWLDGPAFRRRVPWAGTWRAGDGARVFPLRTVDGREVQVMPLICLDDVDSGLAIDGARLGAQAILGMSNDSWFTDHPVGAELHLAVAAFRSIETRLPQLRVTANGVSAVIDATGTVTGRTGMGERTLLVGEIAARTPPMTLMVRWGDWVGPTSLAALLLSAIATAIRLFRRRFARRDVAKSAIDPATPADVVLLSPVWRIAATLLRVFAAGALLWMGTQALLNDGPPINPVAQIWMFVALVLAPEAAARSLLQAFAATLHVGNGVLVLMQAARRIEIPANDIVDLRGWRLPLPMTGLRVVTASGQRYPHIAGIDPEPFVDALIAAGATPALAAAPQRRSLRHAHALHALPRRLLDHPMVKFGLFPLLPALPAFRLHQMIAYGGTFGEWRTFGFKAWLLALLIWWASWAVNLAMIAGGLRVVVETGTFATLAIAPTRAPGVRRHLDTAARLLFYIGVPLWLLMKLWPW